MGDPFKDTSGPSLNILIKLLSMVSIVFASFIVSHSFSVKIIMGCIPQQVSKSNVTIYYKY